LETALTTVMQCVDHSQVSAGPGQRHCADCLATVFSCHPCMRGGGPAMPRRVLG